jgi:hypothetical protein
MRFRRTLVVVLAALCALGGALLDNGVASAAAATEVGGGAAAVQINVYREGGLFDRFPALQQDIPIALPVAELPEHGTPVLISRDLVGYDAGVVSAHVLRATTIGNLDGTPFAHSTASIGEVAISGTNIRAISSECTWDTSVGSPVATSTIVDLAGNAYTPAPNTRIDLPLLGGYLMLNEQGGHTLRSGAQVIWVKGARLHLVRSTNRSYTNTDITLAFSSCDPIVIPGLSGLKLTGGSSG